MLTAILAQIVVHSVSYLPSLISENKGQQFKKSLKKQGTSAFSFQNITVNSILLSTFGEQSNTIFVRTVITVSQLLKPTCYITVDVHPAWVKFYCGAGTKVTWGFWVQGLSRRSAT
jgi:hypothetical protein